MQRTRLATDIRFHNHSPFLFPSCHKIESKAFFAPHFSNDWRRIVSFQLEFSQVEAGNNFCIKSRLLRDTL